MKKYSREEELDFFQRLREAAGLNKDAIACVICGKPFRAVCNHAVLKHGISAREYKLLAGLPLSVGVTTPDLQAKRREIGLEKAKDNMKMEKMRVAAGPPMGRGGWKQEGVMAKTLGTRARKWQKDMRDKRIERFEERRADFTRMWLALEKPVSIARFFGIDPRTVGHMRVYYGLPERIVSIALAPS